MNDKSPDAERGASVIFFEGGSRGGSVLRLLTLLDNWNRADIRPAVVTVRDEAFAQRLRSHVSVKASYSLRWPSGAPTDPVKATVFGPFPTKYFFEYFALSARALASSRHAVAYFNNTPHMHIPAILCARLTGHKVVCHLRDTIGFTRAERVVSRWIDRFVVLSESAKNFYEGQLGNRAHVDVVYDGIDVAKFATRRGNRSNAGRSCVAVCVGTLSHRKGQDVCLKALSLVHASHPSAKLRLVGAGEDEGRLRELSKQLGLEHVAEFLGHVDDIGGELAGADIGVLGSRREGFPNSVMEYMASGLPVIVTELNGIQELVTDGQSGFVVPQEDAVFMATRWIQLIEDANLRVSLGAAGQRTVEQDRFSLDAERDRVASIIRSLA